MKTFLLWLGKTSLRVALFVFLAYCYETPPGHALDFDFIPKWLETGIVLGLAWPMITRWIKALYEAVIEDIAAGVVKRIGPEYPRDVDDAF
jgi:hypothetical protein